MAAITNDHNIEQAVLDNGIIATGKTAGGTGFCSVYSAKISTIIKAISSLIT